MKLIIGNKNYSTWSLRPWLLLQAFNIEFKEIQESLKPEGVDERLGKYSPTNKVPVLIDKELIVWDSLAICEYISEKYLDNKGWPKEIELRAQARAICSEMHSGFIGLRNELPMNCRAEREVALSAEAKKDVLRIDSIWSTYSRKNTSKGPWLFGEFSIADCFFAPVSLRLQTYGITLSADAEQYSKHLRNHESVIKWVNAGILENETLTDNEVGD